MITLKKRIRLMFCGKTISPEKYIKAMERKGEKEKARKRAKEKKEIKDEYYKAIQNINTKLREGNKDIMLYIDNYENATLIKEYYHDRGYTTEINLNCVSIYLR